jgi:hypothetical protein
MPLSNYLTLVLLEKEEGLVVKGGRSYYLPGERDEWYKVLKVIEVNS